MNIEEFYHVSQAVPFLLSADEVVDGESNASIMAKVAWKYRVKPGYIAKYMLQNNRGMLEALSRDVAVSGNSVTDKSLQVDERLAQTTGLLGHRGSYSYLRTFLDRGARGLISGHKKWCARCYAESMSEVRGPRRARVSDQLYWSLSLATHCQDHLCSLSECCGKCFQKQPYISSVVEPGFCHWCYARLSDAPSVETDDDDVCSDMTRSFLKYDVFYPKMTAPKAEWTMNRLAQNLRSVIELEGESGVAQVSSRCGISEHTLKDWCRVRHGISFESLANMVEGFGLERASDLFLPTDSFCSLVAKTFSRRIAMTNKQDRSSAIPKIDAYLKSVLAGKKKAMPRSKIAKRFGVSIGMLEHGFRYELQKISELYEAQRFAESLKSKNRLQFEMNRAVRRCGAKGRRIDWPHIISELQNVDLRHVTQRELDVAKTNAVRLYRESKRRDQSRDVDALIGSD